MPAFPLDSDKPEKKSGKEWLIAYAKAAFESYNGLNKGNDGSMGVAGYASRNRYREIKKYALGREDPKQYKPQHTSTFDSIIPSQEPTVLPIIPHVRRIALAMINKQEFTLSVDTVDPTAQAEIATQISKTKAKIQLRKAFAQANMPEAQSPVMQPEVGEPEDMEGLHVMSLGARHATAIQCEKIISYVFNATDYEDLCRLTDEDRFDFGIGGIKEDVVNGRITLRRVDPRRLIMSYCTDPLLSDLIYIGEVIVKTPSQLLSESEGLITEADLKEIYKNGKNEGGSSYGREFNDYETFYQSGNLSVFDLEILTTDTEAREERIDKRGNIAYGKTDINSKDSENVKVTKKKVQRSYHVKWLIGTDCAYDYGRNSYIKRHSLNPISSNALLSYNITTISMYDMVTMSATEQVIPYAKAIQTSKAKLERDLNFVAPPGFEIDVAALSDVSMGGDKYSERDLLDLFLTRGITLKSTAGAAGNREDTRAIIPTPSQMPVLTEFWNSINYNMTMISKVLGLNDVTDNSTPNPRNLNSTNAAAIQSTNNSLANLFYAKKRMREKVALSIVQCAQILIKANQGDEFIAALGADASSILKKCPPIDKYTYAITVEEAPTDGEEAVFNGLLSDALAKQQVNIDDALELRGIPNLKEREAFLAYRVKKNRDMQQQQALQQQQQTGQVQMQSAQAAEQSKQQTLQLEYQLKMQLAQFEAQAAKELATLNIEGTLEKERISATGRVEASFVQAKEREDSNLRDNKQRLIKEDKSNEIHKIDVGNSLKTDVDPTTNAEHPLPDGIKPLDMKPFSFVKPPTPPMPQRQPAQEPDESSETPQDEAMEPTDDGDQPQGGMPPSGDQQPPAGMPPPAGMQAPDSGNMQPPMPQGPQQQPRIQ